MATGLALKALALGADKIPDRVFEAVPGGYYRPKDKDSKSRKSDRRRSRREEQDQQSGGEESDYDYSDREQQDRASRRERRNTRSSNNNNNSNNRRYSPDDDYDDSGDHLDRAEQGRNMNFPPPPRQEAYSPRQETYSPRPYNPRDYAPPRQSDEHYNGHSLQSYSRDRYSPRVGHPHHLAHSPFIACAPFHQHITAHD